MPGVISGQILILPATAAAFWPVWHWYLLRLSDGSDEPWGVLALFTVLILLLRAGRPVAKARIGAPTLIMLAVYALSFHWTPPIMRAALAVTTLVLILSPMFWGKRFYLGLWALLVLSLPIIPSMEFYLGYPLRIGVAHLAAPLLQLSGIPVIADGANLVVGAKIVAVDAPCAGIGMLWVGAYLFLTLSCLFHLPANTMVTRGVVSVSAVVLGNVLRASSLFLSEAGLVSLPPWGHTAVGATSFLFVVAAIAYFVLCTEKETWTRHTHT